MENPVVVLKQRPGENSPPTLQCFDVISTSKPEEITENQCIVKTLYLSVDPAQRCRMNISTGCDYLPEYQINGQIDGLEGVGVIEKVGVASGKCSFAAGDLVVLNEASKNAGNFWPWAKYFVADLEDLKKVDFLPSGLSSSLVLSYFGLSSGITAICGVWNKAQISSPQIMVISGAAGSCGTLVGQIAKNIQKSTKIIGICGTREKCRVLTEELGFDEALDYKTPGKLIGDGLDEILKGQGVDIYWDNVGGAISDQVIARMNPKGRVILCGQIAVYNTDLPYPPPIPIETQKILETRQIQRDRYLVLNYKNDWEKGIAQLSDWLKNDEIRVKETIYEGLENGPAAFVDMMNGKNIGKMLIRVGE